jgi:hypothetical protein
VTTRPCDRSQPALVARASWSVAARLSQVVARAWWVVLGRAIVIVGLTILGAAAGAAGRLRLHGERARIDDLALTLWCGADTAWSSPQGPLALGAGRQPVAGNCPFPATTRPQRLADLAVGAAR